MKAHERAFQVDSGLGAAINKEKAAGLGLTGRQLEDAIAGLTALRGRLSSCHDREREALTNEYRTLHARAVELKWYLEVQREAMGLRKHGDLDQYFPIPPKL